MSGANAERAMFKLVRFQVSRDKLNKDGVYLKNRDTHQHGETDLILSCFEGARVPHIKYTTYWLLYDSFGGYKHIFLYTCTLCTLRLINN